MPIKNPKKLKILYILPNKLIIFSFVFFIFLFFQVTAAQAVCTYSSKAYGFNCGKIGKTSSALSSCTGQTLPTDCASDINNCECCCEAAASGKINDTMPNFKMPVLQVKIPNLTFTSADKIKAECKEVNGQKTCNFPWIGEYVAGIYKYAIGIVGILAAVVLMVGGVLWIIAGGSATMIGEAKAWIGASLTGLVIALCSYLILYQVNPALVGFNGLNITMVEKIKELVSNRTGGTAEQYKNMPCPTASELTTGVEIYTTGYYIPPRGNDHQSLCMIAMNCSCPAGKDSGNCDDIFSNYKGYQPCKPFSSDTPYCNRTSSGSAPNLGDGTINNPTSVAAPDCINFNTRLCINNKNYIVTDRGGGIQGKRIDIWSGSDINTALKNSGIANMKLGACQ